MKKVISFSIYGNSKKYTVGLLKNLELAKTIYPDWTIYIYYNTSVPKEFIDRYSEFNGVEMINMDTQSIPGMFWRFIPRENVERFIVRDVDSRLSIREKLAVDEWIESDKTLHVLRDHPHHQHKINGGMFGLKITNDFNMLDEINKWLVDKNLAIDNKFGDLSFLTDVVYSRFHNDMLEHNSVYVDVNTKPFPTPMENYKFIGEIWDENENRYPQYYNWIGRKEIR